MEDGCSNRKGACGRSCLSRYSLVLRRRNDAAQLPCPGQARRACEAIRTIHGRRARQRSALHPPETLSVPRNLTSGAML
jgi:hypothetical protein